MDLAKVNTAIEKKQIREKIMDFEDLLNEQDGVMQGDNAMCPVKHTFADGVYAREIFIPKGVALTGKIHKHAHHNFLMSGVVEVVTESGGEELLIGPMVMISAPGTKRALITHEDTVWVTIHHNPTNTQDLAKLEKIVIADSFEEYDRFRRLQDNKFVKFISKIKSLLR